MTFFLQMDHIFAFEVNYDLKNILIKKKTDEKQFEFRFF